MKQGKTLQELGKELQRQRLNRQDFLADTRSLEMESDSYGSMLNLSLEGKSLCFSVAMFSMAHGWQSSGGSTPQKRRLRQKKQTVWTMFQQNQRF